MKKTRIISVFLVVLMLFLTTSCDQKVYNVEDDKVSHTVTLITDEWTKEITVRNGEFYKFPEITKQHYVLTGWTNGEDFFKSSGTWNVMHGETLTPVWIPQKYTITYDYNVNGYTAKSEYTIEDEFALENPFLTGYMFMGWSGELLDQTTKIVNIEKGTYGNKTYTANWLKIQFYGFQYRIVGDEATVIGYYPYPEVQVGEAILSEVEYEGKKYPVTKIADEAFSNMGPFIDKLIIPESIKHIGKNAFYGCDDLELMLQSGVNVEKWLETVIIEDGNDDVADVINGIRPKIGWTIYV